MKYLAATLLSLLPAALAAPTAAQKCANNPRFHVTDLYFHSLDVYTTPAHQNPWGYVSFNATNSATNYKVPCTAQSDQLSDYFYGNYWYKCADVNATNAKVTPGETWFRYDRPSGRVDLNMTWTCNDAPDPIRFTAAGNGTKTLKCQNSEYHNPNWTGPGDIYQTYSTECKKASLSFDPYQIYAVA